MAEREQAGAQPVLSLPATKTEENKDKSIVSSSTPMETDTTDPELAGVERLPQTYQVRPEMMTHSGHMKVESTQPVGITTTHAMMAQPSYVNSSNMQAGGVGAAVMTQGGYITLTRPSVVATLPPAPLSSEVTPMDMHRAVDMSRVNVLPSQDVSAMGLPHTGSASSVSVSQADEVSRLGARQTVESRMTVQQAADVRGMSVPQSAEVSRIGVQHAGDVSRMTVRQAGDIGGMGVTQTDDSRMGVPQVSDARGVGVSQTDDARRVGTPQTDDVSRMAAQQAGGDVRGMEVPQAGDVSRIGVPQTDDVSRMSIQQSGDVRGMSAPQTDVSRISAPQTDDVSRMSVQQAGDVRGISAPQSDVSRMSVQQVGDVSRMVVLQTDSVSRLNVCQTGNITTVSAPPTDVSRMSLPQTADIGRMSLPQTAEVGSTTLPQTSDVGRMSLPQAGEVGSMTLPQTSDVGRMTLPQTSDVGGMTLPQTGDLSRMTLPHTAEGGGMTLPHTSDVGRMTMHHAGDIGRMNLPQTGDVSRLNLAQTGGDHGRLSLPHTGGAGRMGVPHAGDVGRMSASHYPEENSMTLPQTSDVGVMSLPHTGAVSAMRVPVQPDPMDAARISLPEQPPADDINMRMMAAAAEIISRSTPQADDVNMRLMAETADYISRNVPQTSTITTAGSIVQPEDINARIMAQSSDALRVPQSVDVTAGQMAQSGSVTSRVTQPGYVSATVPLSRGSSAVAENTAHTDASVSKAAGAGDAKTEKSPQRPETDVQIVEKELKTEAEQGAEEERSIVPGFRAQFFASQSYSRWKQIGVAQHLRSDEEIACFLMKYYDNTAGVFPSGTTACRTCQRQLTVSCVNCLRRAAEDSGAEGDEGEDSRGDAGGDDPRTTLWKLILEASSKEKEGEAKQGSKEKLSNRRKPRRTRRVPQRKEKDTPTKSAPDSQEEKDSAEYQGQSVFPTNIHFEEDSSKSGGSGHKKGVATPGSRKRGRPSNDSYLLVSTLECSGCQKKFHTMVGLEKHIKLKRCKPPKSGDLVSEEEDEEGEEEVPPSKKSSVFRFECSECKKKYRSKQGLMLHKVSKHGELNAKYQSALSDKEEPEDALPASKDKSSPGMFTCPDCKKIYRSKQGLMLHKVSKHSEVAEKKIKEEKDGEDGKEAEGSGQGKDSSKIKGALVLQCAQCKKKYNSRPGLMLHIKTKHAPQVLLDCTQCEAKFKTKLELRIHIRREHSEGRLILFCPYCPVTFNDRNVLKEHMADNHKTCRQVLYDCFACDLQFSSRIERKRHIQSEHKGKDTSLTCRFCGQWFATRLEYSEHEKVGHDEQGQSWLCATCGDSFPTRYLLQRHTLTHKDKIDCELCGKSITEPCYDDHMKRHYGNKTWQCELCPKSFIRKAELQQHTLVHKDERPFCCELCGVRYREKSRLNSHMRTHSGIKPYKCSQCEKCFTRSRELKNHMRVHTGEKPFSCTVCGRKFASSGNLSAHRRKVHKLSPIPHGQQSRKHMLEERLKYAASQPLPLPAPPISAPRKHPWLTAPPCLTKAPWLTKPPWLTRLPWLTRTPQPSFSSTRFPSTSQWCHSQSTTSRRLSFTHLRPTCPSTGPTLLTAENPRSGSSLFKYPALCVMENLGRVLS